MDNSTSKRHALALRLQEARCPINLSGTDWQKAGDLNPPSLQARTPNGSGRPDGESGIQFAGARTLQVERVAYGVWIEDRRGIPGVILQFTNEARPGRFNDWVMVKASLVYKTGQNEAVRIGAGCWLDQPTDLCPFRVEETHALLVGLMPSQQPMIFSKRRKVGDMGDEVVVNEHTLPRDSVVRVRLINSDSGTLLYEGSFELSFSPLKIVESKTGASN